MITIHLKHPPSTDPIHHPKRYPDPLSRFATKHFADRQTDRPTDVQIDKWSRRMFRHISRLRSPDIQ